MLTMLKDKFLEQRAYKAGVSLVLSKEESMSRVAHYARILLKPDPEHPEMTHYYVCYGLQRKTKRSGLFTSHRASVEQPSPENCSRTE